MKKIINGKIYDTSTATRVGEWSNGMTCRDLDYCCECLYRKKTGEFFLHGEGGPMSRYSRSTGNNSWTGGEAIIPLTFSAAREWAEEHLDGDDYEAIFGPVAEDDTRTAISLSLSAEHVAMAKRVAAERGVSFSALFDELVESLREAH